MFGRDIASSANSHKDRNHPDPDLNKQTIQE